MLYPIALGVPETALYRSRVEIRKCSNNPAHSGGAFARWWSVPFRRQNSTPRRQGAGAQRGEQLIPIQFFAPLASLRLGVDFPSATPSPVAVSLAILPCYLKLTPDGACANESWLNNRGPPFGDGTLTAGRSSRKSVAVRGSCSSASREGAKCVHPKLRWSPELCSLSPTGEVALGEIVLWGRGPG